MYRKPPTPVCKAFLVCRKVVEQNAEWSILGLTNRVVCRFFPAGYRLGFFARWASAHGDYKVEVQLQTMEGEVVWREGPAEAWPMHDPLEECNVILHLTVVFPKPGMYDLVLLANGDEVGRQKFGASLASEKEGQK